MVLDTKNLFVDTNLKFKLDCDMMMHENQSVEMLRVMVMTWWPEEKERIVRGDQCEPAKDPPIVKSVFCLKHKDKK